MKILLTGATGYIGSRLLPELLSRGHTLYLLVRNPAKLPPLPSSAHIVTGDLLDPSTLHFPPDIEAAYYLVHSMGDSSRHFDALEAQSALHFRDALSKTAARQVIYLSGLAQEHDLSRHMASRKKVGEILAEGPIPTTILRASIIIGKESASFQIIRDLVEKLPFMLTPRWVNSLTQPIAINDVLFYLLAVLDDPRTFRRVFEIGGPEVLSYKKLLYRVAEILGLSRYIINVPFLTPRLSAYWLFFVTRAHFALALSLVESLRHDSICTNNDIQVLFPHKLLSFDEAVRTQLSRT